MVVRKFWYTRHFTNAFLGLALVVSSSIPASGDTRPSVEALLEAATQNWAVYQQRSPESAAALRETDVLLRQIITRHSASTIARSLLAAERVEGISLLEVQAALAEGSREMDAMGCLQARDGACFLEIAHREARQLSGLPLSQKAAVLAEIGAAFAVHGLDTRAREVWTDTLTPARTMAGQEIDRSIRMVIAAQLRHGFYTEARWNATLLSDPRDTAARVMDVAREQARAGLAEAAIITAESVGVPDWRASMLAEIPYQLANGGHIEMATRALSHLGATPRDRALNEIARVHADRGQVDDALAAAGRINGQDAAERAMAPIVAALIGAGRTGEASEALGRLETPRRKMEALMAAATAYHETGDQDAAESALVDVVLLLAQEEHGTFSTDGLYANLVRSAARIGMFDFAVGVTENHSRDYTRRSLTLQIAEHIAETGDVARAAEVASAEGATLEYYRFVAAAARQAPGADTITAARDIARTITPGPADRQHSPESLRAHALLLLVDEHHDGPHRALAETIFEDAVRLVGQISNREQQARLLTEISLSPVLQQAD